MGLRVARDLVLPDDLVTKTVGILAQRRKGKTYTASVIAEEMVKAHLPFVVLDPTGAWWGLRASADGKSEGLPVTVLGGQHGDIPLNRTDGKLIAELVVDEPGWYILDLSLFESKAADRQFATDFAERLYRRKAQPGGDTPLHLFVDEADIFVPQVPGKDGTTMLGAYETLVRRGGLRGLGTTLISQRSAVVNKNVLEMVDLMVVLRTVGPNDRKRIEEIVEAAGTKEQVATLMGSLASLDIGEAWFWEPGEGLFERRRIRERRTFNSSATPKSGEKRVEPKRLAPVDLDALKERMEATIQKADAEDPKKLQARIRQLEKELREQPTPAAPDPEIRTETVEIPVVPQAVLGTVGILLARAHDLAVYLGAADDQRAQLVMAASALSAALDEHEASPAPPTPARAPLRKGAVPGRGPVPATAPRPAPRATQVPLDGPGGLGKAERAFLTVLVTHGAMDRARLALLAGYSVKSRHVDNVLGALRSRGLATPGFPVEITQAGVDQLGGYEPLPAGNELRDYWLSHPRVSKAAAAFLAVLFDSYPHTVTRDQLAEAAGYSVDSRHVDNTLGALRTMGLAIGDRNAISADPVLMG